MRQNRWLVGGLLAGLCLGTGLGCGGDDKSPKAENKGVNLKERAAPSAPGGAPKAKRGTTGNASSQ
jgi:hypothetical protein